MDPGSSMPHSQGLSNKPINRVLRPCVMFLNKWGIVSLMPNPKLEDHSLSAVHNYLFNIFATNLHIWRPTPPSATQGRRHAVVTGTHKWGLLLIFLKNYFNWGLNAGPLAFSA